MSEKIKKPSIFLHYTEVFRASNDFIKGYNFIKNYQIQNFGNNKKIIVIPGLINNDLTTIILRKFLKKCGFDTEGWGLGVNYGLSQLELITTKIKNLSIETNQKIILIGWSMGGIFAREVAKKIPNYVENIITIGSPFSDINAPNWAKFMFDLINRKEQINLNFVSQIHKPANIRTLALYSKTDGVVPWEVCKEVIEDDLHENKEIFSSHFGMGMNIDVMLKIEIELKLNNKKRHFYN